MSVCVCVCYQFAGAPRANFAAPATLEMFPPTPAAACSRGGATFCPTAPRSPAPIFNIRPARLPPPPASPLSERPLPPARWRRRRLNRDAAKFAQLWPRATGARELEQKTASCCCCCYCCRCRRRRPATLGRARGFIGRARPSSWRRRLEGLAVRDRKLAADDLAPPGQVARGAPTRQSA